MRQLNLQTDSQKTNSTSPQPRMSHVLSPWGSVPCGGSRSAQVTRRCPRWRRTPHHTDTPQSTPRCRGQDPRGQHRWGHRCECRARSGCLGDRTGLGKNGEKKLLGRFQNCAGFWSKFEGLQRNTQWSIFQNGSFFPTLGIFLKAEVFSLSKLGCFLLLI